MKDKIKKILLINAFFLIFIPQLSKAELIIPLKKPRISIDQLKKSKIGNLLIPRKKPVENLIENESKIKKPKKKI